MDTCSVSYTTEILTPWCIFYSFVILGVEEATEAYKVWKEFKANKEQMMIEKSEKKPAPFKYVKVLYSITVKRNQHPSNMLRYGIMESQCFIGILSHS